MQCYGVALAVSGLYYAPPLIVFGPNKMNGWLASLYLPTRLPAQALHVHSMRTQAREHQPF